MKLKHIKKKTAEVMETADRTRMEMSQKVQEFQVEARRRARESAREWHRFMGIKHMCIGALFFALLTAVLSYSGILEELDQRVSDAIFQIIEEKRHTSSIKIIAIDEETVSKYGAYDSWSRSRTAEILEILNQNDENAPNVIGIDLDYSDLKESEGDEELVAVSKRYKNICLSASAIIGEKIVSSNKKQKNRYNMLGDTLVTGVEMPYRALAEEVTVGIINSTINSEDGFVRNTVSNINMDGTEIDSFAIAIYKMYRDSRGKEYILPKLDEAQSFSFTYSSRSKDYTVYSFADVLEGKIDASAFSGCIVFIGDYTEDGNTFNVPNQRGTQMQEVEMQANILEALLGQRTGQQASKEFMAVYYAFFMALFFVGTSYCSGRWTILVALLINVIQLVSCWIIEMFGYYVNILVPLILVVVISVYNLFIRYAIALQNQYAIENVFKKYVDESVISELGKDGLIRAQIGGASKDIAVLFVDIRGFTTLSESLPPEQIVEILNNYLALVAEAVSKYQGTLDKFIGDAAMAVFNSPGDLADYEYKAVCAAWALRSNAAELNEKCQKEYGKQVAFGIGIQCGNAVIGNIGCETRMDYTAIGDTVNTAARLEGAAAPGQILISEEMEQRLKGRIQTAFAGEYSLKGKKNAVPAYSVEGIVEA